MTYARLMQQFNSYSYDVMCASAGLTLQVFSGHISSETFVKLCYFAEGCHLMFMMGLYSFLWPVPTALAVA